MCVMVCWRGAVKHHFINNMTNRQCWAVLDRIVKKQFESQKNSLSHQGLSLGGESLIPHVSHFHGRMSCHLSEASTAPSRGFGNICLHFGRHMPEVETVLTFIGVKILQ